MAEQSCGDKLNRIVRCGMTFGDEVGDEFDLDGIGWHGGERVLVGFDGCSDGCTGNSKSCCVLWRH